MQTYTIQSNDTLAKIAARFYNDGSLYRKLAQYNGITNPNRIFLGQRIEIPAKNDLLAPAAVTPVGASGLATPHGLSEILATFGNIYNYIAADGTLKAGWESNYIERATLPFPIPLSWDLASKVTRIQCHKKLKEIFAAVFEEIDTQRLRGEILTYGGCYNYRAKRTSSKLSAHSWGIAIDLNPQTNAQGTAGNMHPGVVAAFQKFGFKWGGEFQGASRDPMHFQFCTGY
ncbi:MAG TPA: M15 family metallopeptidase [Terriglobales bacterium]|nr:M15 family metallopeptidase [Terriglobales bacterium]